MILQALAGYYKRMADEAGTGIATEGFEKKEIPFVIIVDRNGEFVGLQDTREGDGNKKNGRLVTVPKGIKKTSGIAANLLWGNTAYLLARPKLPKKNDTSAERAKEQQRCFIALIREMFPEPVQDEGIYAALAFLERGECKELLSHPAWKEIEESGCNLTFKLDTDPCLVCQRPAVVASVTAAAKPEDEAEERQICLVTGEEDIPARLHTSIKGVWGAQSSGANIVSFNHDAFRWFGKEQGLNAPVGKRAEFAYTTALNTLLAKGSQQRLQVGDASTVFWAERKSHLEDLFGDLFQEPSKEKADQLNIAVGTLFESATSSASALSKDSTPFYILGLSPNAGRIAVRFWHGETVAETVRHIMQHFDDCNMVHGQNQPAHLSIFRLLASTALLGKSENIQPNLAGAFMKAIVSGTSYPHSLLASVIRRCRADGEVTYPRAAMIKGVLVREARSNKSEKEIGMALDITDTTAGYLLGRLFSVLERAQESAIRGLNTTIRDRFYGTASSTPMAVFPHLMKLKNSHIAKLENKGQAVNLEKLIGQILSGLQDFPAHLTLQDQGRFAVGYYHQRQSFFTKENN